MKTTQIKRKNLVLRPDRTRVLLRPFLQTNDPRAFRICANVMALPESKVHTLWAQVKAEFGERHVKTDEFLERRFEQLRPCLRTERKLSRERKLLLGSYFSHEYSLEAAALFNPSIVPHPDQTHLPRGALRFILSLRATGEGHISSITFRVGILDARDNINLTPATHYCLEPAQTPNLSYEKVLFERKLQELGLVGGFSRRALHDLPDEFTLEELSASVSRAARQLRARKQETADVARKVIMLAQSNYEVQFASDSNLSERVLFPTTPSQSNGIEDARFVLFQHEDGARTYYATYTAYDGRMILPQFIQTPDFLHFKFITLNGPAVQNKGMALFPRKIHGRYAMLGRQDYENIYVMFSDHLHFWHSTQLALTPKFPWEFIQMGNCGSPIETEAGWLVLSHGVGAMRKYCIGAFLLDRDDPTKVIGRLREPLIKPNENEREGYVPNVVYSCGSLLHGRQLIIPYAMSDSATTFATLSLDDVLSAME
ncbi:MAG: glycoside hydrolase family 130 protein [Kiritimatiellae bacterium]|nr:glycoside hydrolase family 130 protein [Kiritimatiellia bacterium]MDD5520580.1 glycoside hydrolase family 130 protein [Kiritimatiellia bacterium]